MTASQIIGVRQISEIWSALGGDQPKHGRARAFYRDGDNRQAVSLNDEKGVWFDHRDNIGGGVLDLVRFVRGCDRGGALRWLADFVGVPLDDRPMTPAERRNYAQARDEAEKLVAWKERMLSALRAERARWWNVYHGSLRYVLDNGFDSKMGDAVASLHEISELIIERLNRQVDMLAVTRYADLLPIFRERKRKVAA